MRNVKLFAVALLFVSLFTFSACEEENVIKKTETGEEQVQNNDKD